jgi:hypothetical protein
MKKQKLFTLLFLAFFAFACPIASVRAQDTGANRYGSSRLNNLSRDLVRQTVDLVDRARETVSGGATNTRRDLENAFLAAQVDAAAHLFDDMVKNTRRAAELRDGIQIVADLTRRAPGFGANANLWRGVQRTVSDIQRELGAAGGGIGNGGGNDSDDDFPNAPSTGRVNWRGRVDIETQLHIRGNELETRVVSGPNWGGERYNFTSPLPSRRNIRVEVNKLRGRGTVRVIQQPSRDNDFTAVIQILDPNGGAGDYELDISWR